jgi:hypothetical protein
LAASGAAFAFPGVELESSELESSELESSEPESSELEQSLRRLFDFALSTFSFSGGLNAIIYDYI